MLKVKNVILTWLGNIIENTYFIGYKFNSLFIGKKWLLESFICIAPKRKQLKGLRLSQVIAQNES